MTKKKVFISFDYDNDRHYRYLLKALIDNPRSDIDFEDLTPEEIQSYDIGRIKAVLTTRIRNSTHTLVIIGKHANSYHPDWTEIGTRNWQWWEIEKSAEEGNKFIAVKIDPSYDAPEPLYRKGATWAHSFKVDSIFKAINEA
ncbi:TIR domain-containing protein [Capillibacterium thermochitinicola]|uniref:TIR domain-containing protein n=1 Tax=Capillibacterium thermochitinicola TaxID=2699427 RepID=A0A8J6I2E4_9FIRM|nr:TIR domain-containing protein [Capillibacterium thermochitinicola]MBA2134156.1 TIR domain-containing protein [Capillibacterium thermochitinicola]